MTKKITLRPQQIDRVPREKTHSTCKAYPPAQWQKISHEELKARSSKTRIPNRGPDVLRYHRHAGKDKPPSRIEAMSKSSMSQILDILFFIYSQVRPNKDQSATTTEEKPGDLGPQDTSKWKCPGLASAAPISSKEPTD